MTLELRPFDDDDLEAAGRLLTARHAEHRRHEPLLSPWSTDEETTAAVIETWSADDASGAVAVQDGIVTGFLVGAPKKDPTWGANVWVDQGRGAVLGRRRRLLVGL